MFFTSKDLYFVNDEVRAGRPKLGQTPLYRNHIKGRLPTDTFIKEFKSVLHPFASEYIVLGSFIPATFNKH